ncbi:esterase-like activity of phytase family protein [Stappia sp.]|uniref:esterase-like activity of phytase family protein n=1 Tax=Stappia sp. TaxID=1870903 RepID=UPI003A9A15D1
MSRPLPLAAWRRHLAAGALAVAAALAATLPATARAEIPVQSVTISSKPIAHFRIGRPEQTRFGSLTFLGGLELLAGNRHMGGLSGLVVSPDGDRIVAVADNGLWLTADIESAPDGRPLAIANATVAPVLGPGGRALLDRGRGDAEALALRLDGVGGSGTLFVATERDHNIYAFPWPLDLSAAGTALDLPAGIKQLRHNKGMEAVAFANSGPLEGSLVVIAERGPGFNSDLPGFLIGGATPGTFTVVRQDSYDATDASFLPDGDLLLLERRFTLRHGIGMRLRLLPAAEIAPGALVTGHVLMEAGFAEQIDNMEGVSVHVNKAGETIVSLISDDNRSILQRTLFLRFRLDDTGTPTGAATDTAPDTGRP